MGSTSFLVYFFALPDTCESPTDFLSLASLVVQWALFHLVSAYGSMTRVLWTYL
jgi:hypothetical protein